jgi:hypothetical protein
VNEARAFAFVTTCPISPMIRGDPVSGQNAVREQAVGLCRDPLIDRVRRATRIRREVDLVQRRAVPARQERQVARLEGLTLLCPDRVGDGESISLEGAVHFVLACKRCVSGRNARRCAGSARLARARRGSSHRRPSRPRRWRYEQSTNGPSPLLPHEPESAEALRFPVPKRPARIGQ